MSVSKLETHIFLSFKIKTLFATLFSIRPKTKVLMKVSFREANRRDVIFRAT